MTFSEPVGPNGACFSRCRRWRYLLWRRWDERPWVTFVGLNPSTADEVANDPTVTRCIGYARRWGFGGLLMTNLFAYRSTDPAALYEVRDPVGRLTDRAILWASSQSGAVVLAWGNHGRHGGRDAKLLRKLQALNGVTLECLGVNASGTPKHPLYLKSTVSRRRFSP